MCGIAGIISVASDLANYDLVRAITESQHLRGPDALRVESIRADSPQLVFGHNRLKIVDLSEASNQPLWDHERKLCVIFNGEIYNFIELRAELKGRGHTFVTEGDTEVILEAFKAWGIDSVQRFIGMFAIALWDSEAQNLWLVRDRFGVKPLFVHETSDRICFASTESVLAAALDLAPDLDYANDGIEYLTYERDGPQSAFRNLRSLEPSHWMQIGFTGDGRLSSVSRRYYDLEAATEVRRTELAELSTIECINRLRKSLDSAISLRLRSDVRVGVSISGGLDSSLVAALASVKIQDSMTAFTFGSVTDPFTEAKQVQEIVDRLAIETHYCAPSLSDIVDATWATLSAQGTPFPSGSVIAQYLVYKSARSRGVPVILGGQGADEALMGYRKYQFFLLQQAWRDHNYHKCLEYGIGFLAALSSDFGSLADLGRQRRRFRPNGRISTLFPRTTPASLDHGLGVGTVRKRQLQDVTRFSLPTLLRYEDRNSMGNSIESRLPFLDHRVIEIGLGLPESLKVHAGYGKWALRRIAADYLPKRVVSARRKRGFDVNQSRWIRDGLGKAIRNRLHDEQSAYRSFLDVELDIERRFTNELLSQGSTPFTEAMSLLWLSDCARRRQDVTGVLQRARTRGAWRREAAEDHAPK